MKYLPMVTRGILLNAVKFFKNTKPNSLMELNGKGNVKAKREHNIKRH